MLQGQWGSEYKCLYRGIYGGLYRESYRDPLPYSPLGTSKVREKSEVGQQGFSRILTPNAASKGRSQAYADSALGLVCWWAAGNEGT